MENVIVMRKVSLYVMVINKSGFITEKLHKIVERIECWKFCHLLDDYI